MDTRPGIGGLPSISRVVEAGEPRYTPVEASALAGVPLDRARRLWRAMGFADLPDDEVALSEVDLEMLAAVAEIFRSGVADEDLVLQIARVTGHALGRVAGAQVAAIRDRMAARLAVAEDAEAEATAAVESVDAGIAVLESFILYVWRRHLLGAAPREAARTGDGGGEARTLAVGFADLVGFTAMSDEFAGAGLARVIERFEDVSFDTVARNGARIVKTIGDEVMFVAEDALSAARAGIDLAAACAADPDLPDVRVGLAAGETVTVSGDYFGPAVNLASRLVAVAEPGSVVGSDSFRDAVGDVDGVTWGLPRARKLKGVGRVLVWTLHAGDDDASWLARLAEAIR